MYLLIMYRNDPGVKGRESLWFLCQIQKHRGVLLQLKGINPRPILSAMKSVRKMFRHMARFDFRAQYHLSWGMMRSSSIGPDQGFNALGNRVPPTGM